MSYKDFVQWTSDDGDVLLELEDSTMGVQMVVVVANGGAGDSSGGDPYVKQLGVNAYSVIFSPDQAAQIFSDTSFGNIEVHHRGSNPDDDSEEVHLAMQRLTRLALVATRTLSRFFD